MPQTPPILSRANPLTVGSVGSYDVLKNLSISSLENQCDLIEIRLDLVYEEFTKRGKNLWKHLLPFPLLFTARSHAEGSPYELDAKDRCFILNEVMEDASLIDIEASSISELNELIPSLREADIPWIASFHNFSNLPKEQDIAEKLSLAKAHGASCFKLAAHLNSIEDLATLLNFQKNNQGFPIATMGMGLLGPSSRLLCAQMGSVLNYGYLGEKPTAPGQWSAHQLRLGIKSLHSFS